MRGKYLSIIKGWLWLPFFLINLPAAFSASAGTAHPFFIFESWTFSEPLPIYSALNSLEGDDFEHGEIQWTWNWIELGFKYEKWGISLVQRYDYDLRFSKDTADLFWRTSNKYPLPEGEDYKIRLQVNSFHSTGIRFSFTDKLLESLDCTLGLSYLRADHLIDGLINGNATIINDSDYDFEARVGYYYSEDILFDRKVNEPIGRGFSIDAEFTWLIENSTLIEMQVRDLFARIYWEDSPYTTGKATSDSKKYDENGYVSIDPVLSGYEGIESVHVQKLDPRWYLKLEHPLTEEFSCLAQSRYQYSHALFGLGCTVALGNRSRLSTGYWPLNHTVEMRYMKNKFELIISADHTNIRKMRTFWISFSLGVS